MTNASISNLSEDTDLVVTHKDLTDRARAKVPDAIHVSVDNFLGSPKYDEVVTELKESREAQLQETRRGDRGNSGHAGSGPGVMELSAREIQVIEVLLRHPEGLTAGDIASRLGVSARTVHRDLQPASEFLGSRGLTLEKQSGRGLRVEGSAEARVQTLEALREAGTPGAHAGREAAFSAAHAPRGGRADQAASAVERVEGLGRDGQPGPGRGGGLAGGLRSLAPA